MKRLFILALLILALAACGSSATNTGTAVTPQPTTPVTQAADTPTAAPTHFKVGQTVKVGNTWQLTIKKAQNDGSTTYLEPGQVFLMVQVKAVNISSTEQTMSSLLAWTVRDAEGNRCKGASVSIVLRKQLSRSAADHMGYPRLMWISMLYYHWSVTYVYPFHF